MNCRVLPLAVALHCCAASVAFADTGVVQSKDKSVQITLPDGWETAVLTGPKAKIQAECSKKNAYVVVKSAEKSEFNIRSNQSAAAAILANEEKTQRMKLSDRVVTGPKSFAVNGNDVEQYEVRGAFGYAKIVIEEYFIESPTRWNQIIIWTTPSHLDEVEADKRAMVESFCEVQE